MSGTGMPTRMACCGLAESINALSRSRPARLFGPRKRRVASGTRLQRLTSEPHGGPGAPRCLDSGVSKWARLYGHTEDIAALASSWEARHEALASGYHPALYF